MAAEASFNTEILSMSAGLILLIPPARLGIPSTTIRADEFLKVYFNDDRPAGGNNLTLKLFTNDYTPLICALSMNGAVVEAVQTFRTPAMDMFFIVIYIYFYIFMLLFTPLLLSRSD